MSICLGVKLGPSFAEYCLVDTTRPKQPLAFRRVYTPTETISASLKQFLKDFPAQPPQQILIASNHLEKILETKLGGTVAQVVTKGFENWPLLRQNLQKPYFEITPQRTEPLASQDLIFGISERIDRNGKVLRELELSELEFITSKLKMMNVERVCVNLLFSDANPAHLKRVAMYFQEQGFEVYASENHQTNTQDEILLWRKNVLNASLSGTFKDVKAEFLSAIEGTFPAENLFFLDGDQTFFQDDIDRISSSLFGPAQAQAHFYQDQDQILSLGLEKWQFIKPQLTEHIWQSPWGPLAGKVPVVIPALLQPTQELVVDDFSGLNWSSENLGFEPGPMSMSRGFRPTAFDVLMQLGPSEELQSWVTESGRKKFLDNLTALKKHTKTNNGASSESLIEFLINDIVDRLGMQVLLERENPKSPVILTGLFARILFPHFQKRWKELSWQLCPYSHQVEGMSVAGYGLQK